MAVITVGNSCTARADAYTYCTHLDLNTTANGTGWLDTFEIYSNENIADVWFGVVFDNGSAFECRDGAQVGAVSTGYSIHTGFSVVVQSGDYIICYGKPRRSAGGSGYYDTSGNKCHPGNTLSGLIFGSRTFSIRATGSTEPPTPPYSGPSVARRNRIVVGSLGKVNRIPTANWGKYNRIPIL